MEKFYINFSNVFNFKKRTCNKNKVNKLISLKKLYKTQKSKSNIFKQSIYYNPNKLANIKIANNTKWKQLIII